MYGGVQFICPAMHGGGAKRAILKFFLKLDEIWNIFRIWAKNKKNRGWQRGPTRQRLHSEGRGFPARELDDGEVSTATKGSIVLSSPFRVDWGKIP